jgi:hypothetical protein
VDLAGNFANAAVSGINVDETPPSVVVTGVSSGAVYMAGSVPAAGCQTTDGLSGVASPAALNVTGGPTGTQTATCSGATDVAGNAAPPVQVSYTVAGSLSGGTTTCNGTFGGSGTNVTVPAGAVCTLIAGTTVTGNISVLQGGALDDEGVIGGNIGATGAVWIKISGGTISGNVGISGLTGKPPSGNNRLCNVTVNGNVSVSSGGSGAPTDVGTLGSCAGSQGLTIGGNLTVQGNAAAVQIGGNSAKGNITVSNNTGGGTLTGNSASLACLLGGNVPGIVGSSNSGATGNTCNATA